ncbi:hypothetical protein LQ954_12540 [Sphingomonas sp. IC-11]|uniref:hypothetical protein n=1 Tax=Sphingomonas sp. IC-11 TaxID=2898528 RepID=UPI001E3A61A7|nr:hypothetical protein [Sphingomonas sp. IC-11]MCD2316976.1 hypothetical protein [Sphingomonas sp. IC-11]
MSEAIQGMILFVDDVRDEVGGKTSLMGIAGQSIDVFGSDSVRQSITLMFWAPPGEHKVKGTIVVENAPDDYKQPPPLNTTIPDQGGEGRTLVQMVARLRPIKLGEAAVRIIAKFTVDQTEFSSEMTFDYKGSDRPPGI